MQRIVYPSYAGSIPVLGAKFIVNSRSNSFDRLRQKQGSEMQEYIIGESPVGKRNLFHLNILGEYAWLLTREGWFESNRWSQSLGAVMGYGVALQAS